MSFTSLNHLGQKFCKSYPECYYGPVALHHAEVSPFLRFMTEGRLLPLLWVIWGLLVLAVRGALSFCGHPF